MYVLCKKVFSPVHLDLKMAEAVALFVLKEFRVAFFVWVHVVLSGILFVDITFMENLMLDLFLQFLLFYITIVWRCTVISQDKHFRDFF